MRMNYRIFHIGCHSIRIIVHVMHTRITVYNTANSVRCMVVNYLGSLTILLTTCLVSLNADFPRRTIPTIVHSINMDYLSCDSYCKQLVYCQKWERNDPLRSASLYRCSGKLQSSDCTCKTGLSPKI